jgi:site-specific DNA-methyltransferase (adenine-specific)
MNSINGALNKIILGDSASVLGDFPDKSIDLVVTSPPYDNVRDYHGFNLDLLGIGKQIARVLKPGGVAAVVMQDGTHNWAKSLTTFRMTVEWCDNTDLTLFETVIYSKYGKPGAWWNKRFRVDHEYILIFVKDRKPKYFNKEPLKIPAKGAGRYFSGTQRKTDGKLIPIKKTEVKLMKCPGTIWHYNTSNNDRDKTKIKHPATFPDKLASDLILCFSQLGDIVLDPFIGSGTTAIIARNLGREFIGIDISEEYCNLSLERLKQ